jgi:hypothetical protein
MGKVGRENGLGYSTKNRKQKCGLNIFNFFNFYIVKECDKLAESHFRQNLFLGTK